MAQRFRDAVIGSFGDLHCLAGFKTPASAGTPFRLDEGYSEETRSQSEGEAAARAASVTAEESEQHVALSSLPDWVLALTEEGRSEFAFAILRSLRTSSIAAIVERLNSRLHLDPVLHLPPEVTFQILSYLDPETVLRASTLSKTWRTRAVDSQLWKLLFRYEGWASTPWKVRQYEEAQNKRKAEAAERRTEVLARRTRVRRAESSEERHASKKRVREQRMMKDGSRDRPVPMSLDGATDGAQAWAEQHGIIEADDSPSEDRMQDISYDRLPQTRTGTSDWNFFSIADGLMVSSPTSELKNASAISSLLPPAKPSLLLDQGLDVRVNWHYLYKQKRRLEENWNDCRFKNFQLPHPDHKDEAHSECVYTIQYSGKYLVSGSRDRTVRIWDLDTQRLTVPPLRGHGASVLCLQFDERPEQDIVVTAGSDCHVIIWRFSDGQIIKRLDNAHSESVLNLRFDDTFLITCSKDKTIKVWNRKALLPTDDAYPRARIASAKLPSYIIDIEKVSPTDHIYFKPLPEYMLLMTLDGHSAAVNAIQILDGQIVSASGDRTIKVWDVRTGSCLMTMQGHTKGIACVQFDGKRIVSGSSDETVRIFDRATGAEVGCLKGHSNLVRTVQAYFGDLSGAEVELETQARESDRRFWMNDLGVAARPSQRQKRGENDILAYGAKLPPGGGGNRWSRIVSGSYDETVIIWRKTPNGGKWFPAKRLRQNEARGLAGGRPRAGAPAAGAQVPNTQQGHQAVNGAQAGGQANPPSVTLAQMLQAHATSLLTPSNILPTPLPTPTAPGTQPLHQQITNHAQAAAIQQHLPVVNTAQAGQQQPNAPHGAAHHHHHHPHHHHAGANNAGGQAGGNSPRVFKLQFDARRIVCCSTDPVIVGWDFANGDPELELVSQFFGEG
ncbi:hypothetical protein W97_06295 [Coniosporium apollinis CBS 100218]|uniref:F-box domain-containing protein n=1 Tax=Coniosporium apollinis (strain CBS 100218) TaxID=1168221 RepID=R7YYA2_CONA1|nr:uncharacterized protein W97_06295 [Coniosporium apollinis CBS 100218]EON66892.1 hypothetical protein W97_06295 [Coniosporium apollinis CBS 100218]